MFAVYICQMLWTYSYNMAWKSTIGHTAGEVSAGSEEQLRTGGYAGVASGKLHPQEGMPPALQ
jgi:hypothetical protein